jgi:YHS domain-containing protein
MKPMFLTPFRLGAAVAAAAILMGTALPALAYDVTSTAAINVDAEGVILRGVDATSYADGGAPVAGSADFTAEVDGATYRFASADARDSFVATPEACFRRLLRHRCRFRQEAGRRPGDLPHS